MSLAAAPDHRDTSQDESSRGRFQALLVRLHALPLPAKGPAFEAVVRWYLENAPQFRGVVQRVFAWREWPGRWGPDAGIDLVAELQS
ncbi:MAG: hypothetical protein E6G68_10275, partial [Actinobacteria bacterium]